MSRLLLQDLPYKALKDITEQATPREIHLAGAFAAQIEKLHPMPDWLEIKNAFHLVEQWRGLSYDKGGKK